MNQNREKAYRAHAPSPDLCGIGCYWDLCDQYQVWTAKEGLVPFHAAILSRRAHRQP